MSELEIRNLYVRAGEKEILRGLDLTVGKGEIHALMGPNGSGKSTLANVIMGHPGLEITEGQIIFKGEDITEADPDERARAGLFMAFQYPVAVPGVTVTNYQRILHLVEPSDVHVMFQGRIVKEGGPELVDELEAKGYGWIAEELGAAA